MKKKYKEERTTGLKTEKTNRLIVLQEISFDSPHWCRQKPVGGPGTESPSRHSLPTSTFHNPEIIRIERDVVFTHPSRDRLSLSVYMSPLSGLLSVFSVLCFFSNSKFKKRNEKKKELKRNGQVENSRDEEDEC